MTNESDPGLAPDAPPRRRAALGQAQQLSEETAQRLIGLIEHNPLLRPETVGQAQRVTEETAQRLLGMIERSAPVRTLRASQILSGFLGAVGFALFVVGVEQAAQKAPLISNPYGSIFVGLILLGVTGLLLRKFSGGE